jgi:rare lipoprotein A
LKARATIIIILFIYCHAIGQKNTESGKASFYHNSFQGQETSNGESYNKNDFTAAHRTLPFGTILLVTNKKNNKSVIVRVNDRGPFARSRVIDLSYAAASKIGMVPFGVVQVRMTTLTYLDHSTINDSAFQVGEIWDCYGHKQQLSSNTLYIWKSESWKHAFYMASSLTLELNIDIFIKVDKHENNQVYSLLITNLEKADCDTLKQKLQKEGFLVQVATGMK